MAPSIHRAALRLLDTVRLDSDHGHWALSVLFPLSNNVGYFLFIFKHLRFQKVSV